MQQHDDYDILKLDNQLCFPLYACARKVVNLYTPYFKPLGITYTQYIVFLVLWEKDGITVGDICRKLYLDSGTLTPVLKRMEEQGYLIRTRSKDDERVVTVALTQKGIDIRKEVKKAREQVGTCLNLSPESTKELYAILYQVLESI